ncbi:hypothetical protein [Mycobacterium marinum]|uniref:hypothetical protein n=1 Tax=Mycobacterium marinum TaxID=1781 RepID=UPI0015E1B91E|nr:hypothetical protein [Mycobacterium marinum]
MTWKQMRDFSEGNSEKLVCEFGAGTGEFTGDHCWRVKEEISHVTAIHAGGRSQPDRDHGLADPLTTDDDNDGLGAGRHSASGTAQ